MGLTAAAPVTAVSSSGLDALRSVYERRSDLQAVFEVDDWKSKAVAAAGDMESLEDWARRYGWQEHPEELHEFSPDFKVADDPRDDLGYPNIGGVNLSRSPKLVDGAAFNFNNVTADKVLVIDVASRDTLLARRADDSHPLASLSKLMTAKVVLDAGVDMWATNTIQSVDEVGGARLRVPVGSSLCVRHLFDAALIGSANNAANALARSTGMTISDFVAAMNKQAASMRLVSTRFVDPTGIEVGNVSTAVDVARMTHDLFSEYEIRRATTTVKVAIPVSGETHTITNTDGLLTDPNNGLYVLGGKTGYLIESGWNLAVKLRDYRNKEIIVVVLGSDTQNWSFRDAAYIARWVWSNYRWPA
jgi:D-alanyl-D-alanine endopeptidase (penicillin-binding protein 7)